MKFTDFAKLKFPSMPSYLILLLGLLLLSAGIYSLVQATTSYTSGFHNVDMCANIGRLEAQMNITGSDTNSNGLVWGWKECYVDGMKKLESFPMDLMTAYLYIIFATAMFVASAGGICYGKTRNKR